MTSAYVETLCALQRRDLRFACIGTFGLYLHGVLPADYALQDVDIVVAPDAQAVAHCCAYLRAQGWSLFLWDAPIEAAPSLVTLLEKYYLRARKGGLCLDMVFSGLAIGINDLLASATQIDGIAVASEANIIALKRLRNTPADQLLLGRMRKEDSKDCA